MNNRQDWAYNSPYPRSLHHQSSEDSTAVTRATTTIALLVLGYYALSFFDLWPSTLKRRAYEIFLDLCPASLLVMIQSAMARLGLLGRDGVRFKLQDLNSRQAKSDVLRELLGFENGRITTVVRKARTLSGIDNILPQNTEIGPAGLGNWDNSCYQNSVLHGFASLPAFNRFVSKSWDLMKQKDTAVPTHEALVSFLSKLNASDQPKKTLWTPAALKSMDSWQQQDAQEYFSRVLDAVEKEDLKFYKSNINKEGFEALSTDDTSAGMEAARQIADNEATARMEAATQANLHELHKGTIEKEKSRYGVERFPERNPLDGMLAQSLKCLTCGFTEGLSLTQFNCITVNLGTAGGRCTLEQLLDEYTEPEDIDGVECTQCTKIAQTRLKLADEASTARTDSNPEAGAQSKTGSVSISDRPEEPATSDPARKKLKPVLSTKSKQLTIGRLPRDLVIHLNRSIFDMYGNQRKNTALLEFPLSLAIFDRWCAPLDDLDGRSIQAVYALQCVVTHAGRHDDGHYIAYAKRDKDWYCFNDEVVTKVSEDFVFNRGNAFMLFYEVDDSSVSSEENATHANLGDEVFEDVSMTTSIEEDKFKDCSPTSESAIDDGKSVEATTDSVSSLSTPGTPMTLPYVPTTTTAPRKPDGDEVSSSADTSPAEPEDQSQLQSRLEALLPPMRTASESSTMYQRMESSHAAPVF